MYIACASPLHGRKAAWGNQGTYADAKPRRDFAAEVGVSRTAEQPNVPVKVLVIMSVTVCHVNTAVSCEERGG